MRIVNAFRQLAASLRMLLALTVLLGVAYPLVITAIAQLPGLKHRANGSPITRNGALVGSTLIGQPFSDAKGNPLVQYFQPRPSAAGDGYDPTASSASNLGPESVVDAPDAPSLLTQICARSLAVGRLDGVSGARPFCTADGVGAVLAVFWSGPGYAGTVSKVVSVNQTSGTPFLRSYRGVAVELAGKGADYARGQIVPIRGDALAHPAVPADAVTASGSGLDPDISPAYAAIQVARVAAARGVSTAQVRALVAKYRAERDLGFLGDARVNVLKLNLALDRQFPHTGAH